uniref:Leucine rich repeat containing 38 n=1 Tax=Seriola lalandi dorsalis TaxID=1841481 RepID=A0A3B4Z9D2_SERLL
MLPCINWLQPFLALISSTLLTRGHNCPSSCFCPDHHTVDCTSKGLTKVPDSIPLDVRRLLNNSLSQLEPGTLSTSSRLVFLDLGSNNLTEISYGTFEESRSLIKLRLGNNPYLSMVGRGAFTGLTSLRELELERNGLTTLDVKVLEPLPSLRKLRLEGNPWLCNCNFARLFVWLTENRHNMDLSHARTCLSKSSELTKTSRKQLIFNGICQSIDLVLDIQFKEDVDMVICHIGGDRHILQICVIIVRGLVTGLKIVNRES